MIEQSDVEQQLALDHETRSFEAKGPGDLADKSYVAKIARAAMAMGNLGDGGVVCLGIDDDQMRAMLPGLSPPQGVEWSDFDNVSAAMAKYSDPPVQFDLHKYTLTNGIVVIVLDVSEFDRVPHVCKKGYPGELQNGFTYVRPHGKPESVTIPSSADMHDLLDLAITKGVRRFIRRVGAVGLPLSPPALPQDLDKAAYDREQSEAWPPNTTHRETTTGTADDSFFGLSGYTDVSVRPGTYDNERLGPERLLPTLVEHVVRLRGWPVPMVDQRKAIDRNGNWIAQDISSSVTPHEEAWRLFTSGQFLHRRALATDLNPGNPRLVSTHPDATGAVAVWDVLLYMIEVAEFGARWVTTLESASITFEVALHNVAGRQLISGDAKRSLPSDLIIKRAELLAVRTVATTDLLTETRRVGVDLAQTILRQFGADIPDQVLLDYQAEVFH